MRHALENLTEIEYEACVDALHKIHEETDIEYTNAMEDILCNLDMCEYLDTNKKIALLKEVIDVLQDRDEED